MFRDVSDYGTGRLDKLPPQNIEAEQGVLGAVILDPDALFEVMPILKVSDFYRDAHQVVYGRICAMADAGMTVDSLTLMDELVRYREAKDGVDVGLIVDVVNSIPHTANAVYHAKIVKQKAESRRVIEAATDVLKRAYSNEFTSTQLVADAQADFLAIGSEAGDASEITLEHAAGRALGTMLARSEGADPGVRLPWPKLDEILDGFRPGKLYIFGGRPGSGKSALLFNAADHAAMAAPAGGDAPALFFGLEMSAEEYGERFLSDRADVNSFGFRQPKNLSPDAMRRIADAHALSSHSRLRIDDAGGLTVSQIASRARRCKHRHGLSIVFVDYLQLIDGCKGKGENRQEEVARVSRALKFLAKELRVPVVAASQLNRAVEGRPLAEQVPRLADLRETGQIEQDAHAVVLLHPDPQSGLVNAIVPKNRSGPTGTVALRFVREKTRFEGCGPTTEIVPDAADDTPY